MLFLILMKTDIFHLLREMITSLISQVLGDMTGAFNDPEKREPFAFSHEQ